MGNNKFLQLLEGLDTGLIILIDDDFYFKEDDFESVICDLICIKSEDQKLFLKKLNGLQNEMFLAMTEFIELFNMLPKLEEDFILITDFKKINRYLDKFDDIEAERVKDSVKKILKLLESQIIALPALRDLLIRYGLGLGAVESYNNIISLSSNISLRIYKEKPDISSILEDIRDTTKDTQYCICIVDKVLPHVDGVHFVRNELVPSTINQKIISVIYTSKPDKTTNPNSLKDYYVFEVDKSGEEALEQLTYGLALCCYVEIFNTLKEIHSVSLNKAFDLALSRKNNMIYLASMANEEGITPYEAISRWFQLATEYQIGNEIINDYSQYHYLLGLTHFLHEEFLILEKSLEIEEETLIQNLSTFEIFDYSINLQHQPPAPGDIYQLPDGNYAVLVGQDCDIIVRGSDVERKAKNADLLRAEFIGTHISDKIQERVFRNSHTLDLNYFRQSNNELNSSGVLRIKFEDHLTSDFIILDLSTFNQDGKTSMNLDQSVGLSTINKVIPLSWGKYYEILKTKLIQYKVHKEFCEEHDVDLDVFKINDYSAVDFVVRDKEIDYGLRRVCRIKKEFRDILLNNYWEYRSRIGINTIGLIEKEQISNLDIKIVFPGFEPELIDINLPSFIRKTNSRRKNGDPRKTPLYLEIKELKESIQLVEKYPQISKIVSDSIEIEGSSCTVSNIKFSKEILDNIIDSVLITVPFEISNIGQYLMQDKFVITTILNNDQRAKAKEIAEALYYVYEGNPDQKFPLYNVSRRKFIQLDTKILKKTIIIPLLGLKISTSKGTVSVLPHEVLIGN